MTKQNQIIFMNGKKKGLIDLFSKEHFGYLAIGCNKSQDVNGFEDTENTTNNGFSEISTTDDSSYHRIELKVQPNDITIDYNTKKVTVPFTADLDVDNIKNSTLINQFAIVDNADATSLNTIYYAASTFPEFSKTDQIAITFTIEMTI